MSMRFGDPSVLRPRPASAIETRPASGSKAGAVAVTAAPVLLLGAMLWHPPLPGRLPDSAAVAEAASADLTRWGLSHVAAALASAAIIVAFVAVRGYLRTNGDGWLSAVGLGFVVVGGTLYAMLPGMEFSVLAAFETGADLAASQEALEPWFVPILLIGALLFTVGTVLFAVAVVRTPMLGRGETLVVAVALVVFGLTRLVPVGVVQFYVQPAAAMLALLPLAVALLAPRRQERESATAP